MNVERRNRLIKLAIARDDRAALAILGWKPAPEPTPISVWAGIRWTARAA